MELKIGEIVTGKVKSLTKFGAFILLEDGSTGMVHISEVANTYVSDIHDHLTEGQDVQVMIIGIDGTKINLSIKRTLPQSPKQPYARARSSGSGSAPRPASSGPRNDGQERYVPHPSGPAVFSAPVQQQKSFDDMLKQFMTESDSKIASSRQYQDHKTKTRRK